MRKIVWDKAGDRLYETGVSHGVLYPMDLNGNYPNGVAWNGLKSIKESFPGSDSNPYYMDGVKYYNLMSIGDYAAILEAYTYPDEFELCYGSVNAGNGLIVSQQARRLFGLTYRTRIGNDIQGDQLGYKLHLVYGCIATPTDRGYQSVNSSSDAITFSWDITTTPLAMINFKPTSALTIDSRKIDPYALEILESILYGINPFMGTFVDGQLPLPNLVKEIIDSGGGTSWPSGPQKEYWVIGEGRIGSVSIL